MSCRYYYVIQKLSQCCALDPPSDPFAAAKLDDGGWEHLKEEMLQDQNVLPWLLTADRSLNGSFLVPIKKNSTGVDYSICRSG